MKTTLLIAAVFIAVLFVIANVRGNSVVNEGKGIIFFEGTWDEALQLAKKENKLIFLDAYAGWCGPCKLMKKKVFSKTEVGEFFNSNFINVKIDMEKGEGPTLAEKYGVTAYPSLFFIDHSGQVKKYTVGYLNDNQLIEFAKEALK